MQRWPTQQSAAAASVHLSLPSLSLSLSLLCLSLAASLLLMATGVCSIIDSAAANAQLGVRVCVWVCVATKRFADKQSLQLSPSSTATPTRVAASLLALFHASLCPSSSFLLVNQ